MFYSPLCHSYTEGGFKGASAFCPAVVKKKKRKEKKGEKKKKAKANERARTLEGI